MRPLVDFHDVPTRDQDSLDEDVTWALERLRAVGIRQVVAVNLTKPELDIPVVRVLIPGLEGLDDGERGKYHAGAAGASRERSTGMTTCVFTGPTLPVSDARSVLDAVYLPPVQQGDVYRAVAQHRPRALGIIDGYFQQVPSVWHKEILWAMAQGVHVFGSASMGALRAAELAAFGMRGVGRIFEAYRDGSFAPYEAEAFEDDDEVAVVHGAAEVGFVPLSEAMVNIRCTLASAVEAGVIAATIRDTLARLAKELFYPDRSYQRLLACGAKHGLAVTDLEAFRAWLPAGCVNQKRADALAMLATMRDFLAGDPQPARVEYVFQASAMWNRATQRLRAAGARAGDAARRASSGRPGLRGGQTGGADADGGAAGVRARGARAWRSSSASGGGWTAAPPRSVRRWNARPLVGG